MPRNLSSEFLAALEAREVRTAYLFEAVFKTATIRLWDGIGPLSWDGKTWLGNGWFISPSTITETDRLVSFGVAIQLSGIPGELISLVLAESRMANTGSLWLAVMDEDGGVIDADLQFTGHQENPEIMEDASSSHIELNYESALSKLTKERELIYSHDVQMQLTSGTDRGFEHITAINEQALYWGFKEID